MIEAALPSPDEIVDSRLDAGALIDLMVGKLSDPEHRLPDHTVPFRRILPPILERVLDDPGFATQLAPAFQRSVLTWLEDIANALSDLSSRYGSLANSLDELRDLRQTELYALSLKFGLDMDVDATPRVLIAELMKKSEDYDSYRVLIDGLDERVAAIANLKGAAQDAAERLDFDEVETLLSRVDEVETEIAAETKEARARNALLRGRVEEAFHHFCGAAACFANVDPTEPARRRILRFAEPLARYAMRYGVLDERLKAADAWLWSAGQNAAAIGLQNQGTRTGGAEGAALLAEAVAACRAALEVTTREDHPVNWAVTQNNLGSALIDQGTRTGGTAGAALLAEAVAAYRAALEVSTREDHPVHWALTQENLAIAFESVAGHDSTGDPCEALRMALAHVDAALEIYDPEHMPYDHGTATTLRDRILAKIATHCPSD